MSTPKQAAQQLRKMIRTFPEAVRRVTVAGERIAKQEAPVKQGTLRRSITSRVEQNGRRGIISTNYKIARLVHDGTKPHIIRPKNAKALYWKGAKHPVKAVRHPGTKPNRFFDRTADKLQPVAEHELLAWAEAEFAKFK